MAQSTALITGGAGGIGFACATAFAARGDRIVLIDSNAEAAAAARDRLGAGAEARAEQADVSDAGEITRLACALEDDGWAPDILVNAAGLLQDIIPLAELDDAFNRRVWEVNYWGTFYCCRTFGLAMASRGNGSIVNITSINAHRATPLYAYNPGKAALKALTECLSVELGRSGVRVNAVAPGFTATPPLLEKIERGLRSGEAMLAATSLGRLIEPEQVADAILFLCSSAAANVTGVSLPVDGGWLAGVNWLSFQRGDA